VGYYPFPVGKTLALKITHPGIAEPAAMIGKVVQLYGGAENSLGLLFEKDLRADAKFEQWMKKVLASHPAVERSVTRMPGQLPLDAHLRRGSTRPPSHSLSAGERALLERLNRAPRGMSLEQLRIEWGADWERRAQVLFDLVADEIILYNLPSADVQGAIHGAAMAVATTKTTQRLMEQLESEYGPLDKRFAQQVETITQEVMGWGAADGTRPQAGTASQSGAKRPVTISWISAPIKKG